MTDIEELWNMLCCGECSDIYFRTAFNARYSISLINHAIVVFCEDEYGKFDRCHFRKNTFISLAEEVFSQGELKDIHHYMTSIPDSFSSEEKTFLLPVVLYMAQCVLNRSGEYDIEALPEKPLEAKKEDNASYQDNQKAQYQKYCFVECSDNNEEDVIANCRNVFFYPKFEAYYRHADEETRKIINEAACMFSSSSSSELSEYLKSRTNKVLKGTESRLYKIYIDSFSAGSRLIWVPGDKIDKVRYANSIIFLAYVTDHDRQGLIGSHIKLSAVSDSYLIPAADAILRLEKGCSTDFSDVVPPYRFANGVALPQLSGKQEKAAAVYPPAILSGNAGSGKTFVSIRLFVNLYNSGCNPHYLTFSDNLADEVAARLVAFDIPENVIRKNVLTVSGCFASFIGMKASDYKLFDFDRFTEWKNQRYIHHFDTKMKKIDPWIAWTYIRGIIKGKDAGLMDSKCFSEWALRNENMNNEDSGTIYSIFSDYEKFKSTLDDSTYDDNDLAKMVIEGSDADHLMDYVVVDEAQDLTYRQISAIRKITKNDNIFFCGDNNQKINPTIMDLDSIGSVFSDRSRNTTKVSLGNSFRSCQGVINFVNHLSEMRKEYIALQDSSCDATVMTARNEDEGMWVVRCDAHKISEESICSLGEKYSNCIVIVPNTRLKRHLISKNPTLEGRAKTVFEIKGLEYDNVILVDFISENRTTFEGILNGKLRRNTYGRLQFNMLYVAATRSKERLIIWDDIPDGAELSNAFYSNVVLKDDFEEIKRYMTLEDDDNGWLYEGQRLEEVNDFGSAIRAYGRVRKKDTAREIGRCKSMMKYHEGLRESGEKMRRLIAEAANELYKQKEYELSEKVYGTLLDNCGDEEICENYLCARLELGKDVSSEMVKRYVDGKNFLDDFHPDNCFAGFFNSLTQRNEEIIGLLKQANA